MRRLARLGLLGACLQVLYGVVAVVDPYPAITDRGWELLWLAINLGTIASIRAWMMRLPSSGRLTRWGGRAAIAGHGLRALISAVLIWHPNATVDLPIVCCIVLMFGGMTALGIDSLRHSAGWAPLATVVSGVITSGFYSFDKHVHFILLGLLWGSAWLWLAITNVRETADHGPFVRQAAS